MEEQEDHFTAQFYKDGRYVGFLDEATRGFETQHSEFFVYEEECKWCFN